MNDPPKSYGKGRVRSNVSYADVERAAIAILKSERRPTVETLRGALGGGSPDTIGSALRRFWRDLGIRIEGDPAALTRMPADIAELADGMWQRALKLAGDAASHDENAARERLAQLQLENEIKARSFELREREIDTQVRTRERALAEARDHLLLLSKALSREQATNQAQGIRIADLETDIANYRQQIAALIAGAIAQNRPRRRRRATTRDQRATAARTPQRAKKPARSTAKSTPRKGAAAKLPSRRSPPHPARKAPGRKSR